MTIHKPQVSVVVPAYNAEATLAETLASIQSQSLRDIEILVVDDGSTDRTAQIMAQIAADDRRVTALHQSNAGVATARNTGMAKASGQFAAFCDADDIWHPHKLERQVAALRADPQAGLCYAWHRRIGQDDRILSSSPTPRIEGFVLHQHLEWNFISNGSTVLVPMELARATGFDACLHEAGNQGCEDYLFQLRIAHKHRFVCVPAYLVGYRQGAGGMSRGVDRMIRSHLQTFAIMEAVLPEDAALKRVIDQRRTQLLIELSRNRLRRRDMTAAVSALLRAIAVGPRSVPGFLLDELKAGLHLMQPARTQNSPTKARLFHELGADQADGAWSSRRSAQYLATLSELDRRWERGLAVAASSV